MEHHACHGEMVWGSCWIEMWQGYRKTPPLQDLQGKFRLAFSVQETAQILGVSDKTVRRLVTRGLLRSSKALRHLLIPRSEIDRFLKDTL